MPAKNKFASQTGLTSNQVAAIGEALVAIELIKASQGALSPSKPLTDDFGIDLDVYDEESRRSARLQIKTRTTDTEQPKGEVGFGLVSKRTPLQPDHFVLCILLHVPTNEVVMAWLVPTTELPTLATLRQGSWLVKASTSAASQDRFTEYRHRSMAALTRALRQAVSNP